MGPICTSYVTDTLIPKALSTDSNYNNSVIAVGPVCTSHTSHATDTLIPGTEVFCPIISVNKSPGVTMGTKACCPCEMSGADEDIDKYTLTTQFSLGFHSMKPEGEPGVPEQIDLAYDRLGL